MRRRVAIGLALAAVAAMPAVASADPWARLEAGAEVCDPAPLRARIAQLLGRDVFVDDGAAVDVIVRFTVEPDGDGVRGTIEIVDGDEREDGRRVLTAAGCAELDEAAAFALALVLSHPRASTANDEPAAEPAAGEEAAQVGEDATTAAPSEPAGAAAGDGVGPARAPVLPRPAAPVSPPPAVESHDGDMPLRVGGLETYAGVVGGMAGGGANAGIVVGAALRRGRASLGLDFALTAPTTVTAAPGRVVVRTGVFELAGCLRRGRLAGCATLAGGWVRGSGRDLTNPSTSTMPYGAVGGRLAWDAAFSPRLAVRVQAAVRVPVTRDRFLVDQMPVWSTSPVEAWLGIALVARIP